MCDPPLYDGPTIQELKAKFPLDMFAEDRLTAYGDVFQRLENVHNILGQYAQAHPDLRIEKAKWKIYYVLVEMTTWKKPVTTRDQGKIWD